MRSVLGKFLKNCVMCRKLRGATLTQKMAELPEDRLERAAPFEKCGIDVCGPYSISYGRSTRRSNSTKKYGCYYLHASLVELFIWKFLLR